MKYTVTDVTTSHVLVNFANGQNAHVRIQKGWDKNRIEDEISKYIPHRTNHVDFDSVNDVPLSIGDSNNIDDAATKAQKESARLQKEYDESRKKAHEMVQKQEKDKLNERKNRIVTYKERRSREYPSIPDQLDALYHAGIFPEELASKIREVKEKYPKNMPSTTAVDAYPDEFTNTGVIVIDGEEIVVSETIEE